MSIAIHYTSLKPPTGHDREVFGLQVAVADWLRAYFRFGKAPKFSFLVGSTDEWNEIREMASQERVEMERVVALDRRFPEQNLTQFSTVFRPEPDTRHLLWQRQLGSSFNFCGLAHAISGVEAGEVLQDYCLAPSYETDAIICPSHAVRSAIRAFWDNYGDYLNSRFGASYRCPVELPVIPLGVDIEKLVQKASPENRSAQRNKLNIGDDDIVILWVGRLSAAIKAHPLSMFQAVEQASQKTSVKIHFVMVGYFVPHEAEAQFRKMAQAVNQKAHVTFIAADDPRFPDGLWAAGDIFLSLIDNMQESFGLTPIEAMAAGLPRVISDWDGYRDSVADGEDGFLIRTMQPPPGNGFDLTAQVLSGREVYGGFLAKSALTVAVDTLQAGNRLLQLIENKSLRETMADKARARARATYDWKHIIPAYENLWADLAERRQQPQNVYWGSASPQLPDPYTMYHAYPTATLSESDKISLIASPDQIRSLLQNELNTYASDAMLAASDIASLLSWLANQEEVSLKAVFTQFSGFDKPRLWRTIAWMQKLVIIKNSPCQVSA